MYELWDARSLNMIDCYKDAVQAETAIAETVRQHGPAVLDALFLVHEDDNEESTLIAEGQATLVAIKRLSAEERATAAPRWLTFPHASNASPASKRPASP